MESQPRFWYTIRSESDEGVYYLVNGWYKHRAFWVSAKDVNTDMLFKRKQDAKASLAKLLKVMPDYASDKFEMFYIWEYPNGELYPNVTKIMYAGECLRDWSDFEEERKEK